MKINHRLLSRSTEDEDFGSTITRDAFLEMCKPMMDRPDVRRAASWELRLGQNHNRSLLFSNRHCSCQIMMPPVTHKSRSYTALGQNLGPRSTLEEHAQNEQHYFHLVASQ